MRLEHRLCACASTFTNQLGHNPKGNALDASNYYDIDDRCDLWDDASDYDDDYRDVYDDENGDRCTDDSHDDDCKNGSDD